VPAVDHLEFAGDRVEQQQADGRDEIRVVAPAHVVEQAGDGGRRVPFRGESSYCVP